MIGTTISHYRIDSKLGEGGMGVVYKATDTRLRRPVALKFLPPSMTMDEHARRRFIHEAQAASALDHPNIAVVHEIDETEDGQSFICMAYYEGATLRERLGQGALDVPDAVRIASQIADGLQRAHEAGIVHRDIKPANVILTGHNEVKILDFGLAKLSLDTKTTTGTTTGGTAAYMSPEQIHGREADHRSDLFSLGIVLYEMLTGVRPFGGDHQAAVLYSIVSAEAQPPSAVNSRVGPDLDRIISRLLKKNPAERYSSAREAAADLRSFLHEPSPVMFGSFRRKKTLLRVGVTVFGVALVVVSIVVIMREANVGSGDGVQGLGIAVLPFSSIGEERAAGPFVEGMTEVLSDRLTQLQAENDALWVVATTETRRLKVESAMEARAKLGVARIVSGRAFRTGEEVRIIVTLVETERGEQIHSKEFRGSMGYGFQLEQEIVSSVAQWLGVTISSRTSALLLAGGTSVQDVYDLYVKAKGYLRDHQKPANVITAITLLRDAVKEDPAFALAHAALAEALWRNFDLTKEPRWIQESRIVADQAIKLNPDIPNGFVSLGFLQVRTGAYEDAARTFERVLRLDPGNPSGWLGLGRAYDELDDTVRAEKAFKDAIDREPQYWAYRNALGIFYYYRGRLAEALEQWSTVARQTPENVFVQNNIGGVLMRLKRYDEARRVFEKFIDSDPSVGIWSNLGTIHFMAGRYRGAAEAYKKATDLRPSDYQLWGHLAEALHWAGDDSVTCQPLYRRAGALAESVRTVNPRRSDVHYRLAGYKVQLGEKEHARRLLEQAVALDSTYGPSLGRVAMVYEELGDRSAALVILKRALANGFTLDEMEESPAMKNLRNAQEYTRLKRHN